MLSAAGFWIKHFGKPKRDSENLAIIMMSQYAEYYHKEKIKENSLDDLGKGLDRIEKQVDKLTEAK